MTAVPGMVARLGVITLTWCSGTAAEPLEPADRIPLIADTTQADIPRLVMSATVDGVLDDPVWAKAAVLSGFSQFLPVEHPSADDSTEVLVWYSPTGIYFGIRGHELHGEVRGTLADRDRIDDEDAILLVFDTF